MRKTFYWLAYGALLFAVTVAGAELIASFLVPSWPARMLRPVETGGVSQATGHVINVTYNSWGMRDRERSIARPADVRTRVVLVGDSFLEGAFGPDPLSAYIERRWAADGRKDIEAINLGVTATGPRQYYHRIKRVALELKPDAIVLFFYGGNDFLGEKFGDHPVPPPLAELPRPSLLGAVAPRLTWFAVNRLRLSEIGGSNKPIPDEFATLQRLVEAPPARRTALAAAHVRQFYHPQLTEEAIRAILGRGGDALWSAFDARDRDREYLLGWMLGNMIDWESSTWPTPRSADEARRMDMGTVEGSLSWLVAAHRLARDNGVKFLVALAPLGTVDPHYVDYWRHWPRYYGMSILADVRTKRLAARLRESGVPFVDLYADLSGVSGTYRLIDGHWTIRGHEIVAARMAKELSNLR
jgi:lysophospholipase L1-like esterase